MSGGATGAATAGTGGSGGGGRGAGTGGAATGACATCGGGYGTAAETAGGGGTGSGGAPGNGGCTIVTAVDDDAAGVEVAIGEGEEVEEEDGEALGWLLRMCLWISFRLSALKIDCTSHVANTRARCLCVSFFEMSIQRQGRGTGGLHG